MAKQISGSQIHLILRCNTICGRVIAALKSEALLNESIGAGYLDRNWPEPFLETGAWPLTSLRQSFLNGSLTRLVDPDRILRGKIVEFVKQGLFGLASGLQEGGPYERIWFEEPLSPDEVDFAPGVYLLKKDKAEALKSGGEPEAVPEPKPGVPSSGPKPEDSGGAAQSDMATPTGASTARILRLTGKVPPESWSRLGRMVIPKLRTAQQLELEIRVVFEARIRSDYAPSVESDLRRILEDLGLAEVLSIE